MKKIYLFAFLGFVLASCSTSKSVTKSTNSKKHEIETSYNGMLSKPILADLDIEKTRKEVTYEGKLNLPMEDLKLNAKQLFLETHLCDFVVDPIYTTTVVKENLKTKEVTIKLTGLAAKYTNIYQVDSLPKSIGQFYALDNPIKRVNYINSLEEYNPKIGTDLTIGTGGQIGIQVDYPFANEILRGYASFENYRNLENSISYDLVDSLGNSFNGGQGQSENNSTASVGIMKEFQLINRVKLRAQAGLNYSLFDNIGADVESVSRIGLRFGGAIDIKIYRGISAILKGYSNFNFINIYSKDESIKSFKVKNLETSAPSFYLTYGLRFVF